MDVWIWILKFLLQSLAFSQPMASLVNYVQIHVIALTVKDFYSTSPLIIQHLYTQLPHRIVTEITTKSLNFNPKIEDVFTWSDYINGTYTTKRGYSWILYNKEEFHDSINATQSQIWIRESMPLRKDKIPLFGLLVTNLLP